MSAQSSQPPSKPFRAQSCDHHYTQCPCPFQVHDFVDMEQPADSNVALKPPMLALVGSACCLVTGLVLVLVFSHVFVVPHIRTQELISSECYVQSIESLNILTNAPCVADNFTTTMENTVQKPDAGYVNLDTTLSNVESIDFEDGRILQTQGSKRNTRNSLEKKLLTHENIQTAGTPSEKMRYTKPVFRNCDDSVCHVVTVQYNDLEGKLRSGTLYATGLLDFSDENYEKCFCTSDCELLLAGSVLRLSLNDRHIQTGQLTHCYYRRQVDLPSHQRLHRFILLNMMLWPTVLFILGFVGLFFSCIHWQKDSSERKAARKRRHKAHC